MSILNQLTTITGDSPWMYVSAALALLLLKSRSLGAIPKALKALVKFLRSNEVAWIVEKSKKAITPAIRDFTQTLKLARPEAGHKIKLTGAIGNAILFYLFSGLMFVNWLALLAAAAVNLNHLTVSVMMALALLTAIGVPAALYFWGVALKEKVLAKRHWEQCRAEGLRAYGALIATPMMFVGAASIITALQQLGGT